MKSNMKHNRMAMLSKWYGGVTTADRIQFWCEIHFEVALQANRSGCPRLIKLAAYTAKRAKRYMVARDDEIPADVTLAAWENFDKAFHAKHR